MQVCIVCYKIFFCFRQLIWSNLYSYLSLVFVFQPTNFKQWLVFLAFRLLYPQSDPEEWPSTLATTSDPTSNPTSKPTTPQSSFPSIAPSKFPYRMFKTRKGLDSALRLLYEVKTQSPNLEDEEVLHQTIQIFG